MAKKKTTRSATTARKKATTRQSASSARKAPTTRKTPVRKKTGTQSSIKVQANLSPAERDRMVAEAAYYLSEKQGFQPGYEMENWLTAEQQIDSEISQ